MAEIVVLPTKGLAMFEASLRRYLAAKAVMEQESMSNHQVSERLANVFGNTVDVSGINFEFSEPVGAGK
jgi:hypothetical protein